MTERRVEGKKKRVGGLLSEAQPQVIYKPRCHTYMDRDINLVTLTFDLLLSEPVHRHT